VLSARNGAEALEVAANEPPDLLITDILMPVMDGFTLCRLWKADDRLQHIPLIVYTATYTDPKDERFALGLGADRFLVKPMRPELLVGAIGEVLEETRRRSGAASPRASSDDPVEVLEQYNEILFRKLERKVMQLEADIALRRETEEALREKEEFLDTIVESIPTMIYVKDARDLRFVRINRAGEELLGFCRDDVEGSTDYDLFPQDLADRSAETDRQVMGDASVLAIPQERIRTRFGGARILRTTRIPLLDGEGSPKYLLGIGEDITDRVTAEMALSRAQRKLALLNSITFEDIQSAVFSLAGYLELERGTSIGGPRQHYVDQQTSILRSIENSLRFARDYQDLGMRPPAWQNVVHTYLLAISHIDLTGVSRHLRVDGLEIYADSHFEKVFLILAENVVLHGKNATSILLRYREAEDGLILIFEDDGAGVPPDLKERLFERRSTGKRGLGLFLAREILSITDIEIRENGEEGAGARFEIRVPAGGFRFASALAAGEAPSTTGTSSPELEPGSRSRSEEETGA